MELLAVLIGVRVANFPCQGIGGGCFQTNFMVRFTVCLHWLKTRKPLYVFVENCIKEILIEKDISFQYIASEENPADIATRGSSVSEMSQSILWSHGPSWLQNEESSWPVGNLPELLNQTE